MCVNSVQLIYTVHRPQQHCHTIRLNILKSSNCRESGRATTSCGQLLLGQNFGSSFTGGIHLRIGGDLINPVHDIEKALYRLVDNGNTFVDVQVVLQNALDALVGVQFITLSFIHIF